MILQIRCSAELELYVPERRIGVGQLESAVPCFMIAPHYLRFRLAASLRMNQAYLFMQRQRRSDDCHTTGMADVNSNRIRALPLSVFFPLDTEFHLRDHSLVGP